MLFILRVAEDQIEPGGRRAEFQSNFRPPFPTVVHWTFPQPVAHKGIGSNSKHAGAITKKCT